MMLAIPFRMRIAVTFIFSLSNAYWEKNSYLKYLLNE